MSNIEANPGKEPIVDMPPLQEWSGGTEEPRDHEETLQRKLGPQYSPGRDRAVPLKKDVLGPNPIEDEDQ